MASSNDCFAIRKFGSLNVRVLLNLQNQIVIKERELMAMDQASKNPAEETLGCGSLRLDVSTTRAQLLDDIGAVLKDYSEPYLLSSHVIHSY